MMSDVLIVLCIHTIIALKMRKFPQNKYLKFQYSKALPPKKNFISIQDPPTEIFRVI